MSDTLFTPTEEYPNEAFGPGRIQCTVETMIALFGEPNAEDDPNKTDVAWNLTSDAGTVHIYNYKNGPAYLGEGTTLADITVFSVQGENERAVTALVQHVNEATR